MGRVIIPIVNHTTPDPSSTRTVGARPPLFLCSLSHPGPDLAGLPSRLPKILFYLQALPVREA